MTLNKDKRYEIIQQNNTAQSELLSILENYSRETELLRINAPLHGDLNLSVLTEMGFGKIKHIVLGKGEITNLTLPKGIETVECIENLLLTVDNLPKSIIKLNVSYNIIEQIEVSSLSKLELLNVSHNKITTIENLPKLLKEFVCEFNQIEHLDLDGLTKLTVLHASNNKITLIENQPDSIVDIQVENNPSITFRNSQTDALGNTAVKDDSAEKERNYAEAINEYFKLKQKYENNLMESKRQIHKTVRSRKEAKHRVLMLKPKCIKCDRPVGTIFSKVDNRYEAICGDPNNPCSLDIQIFTGELNHFQYLFDAVKENFDLSKDAIIKQKLDTLFNYISEDESVKLFKTELDLYNSTSAQYKDYLDKYNELYKNEQRNGAIIAKNEDVFKLIEKSNALIEEYKKTNNYEYLKAAVELQVKEIIPETRNIRMLKHHIMEMLKSDETMETPGHLPVYTLFQRPASIEQLDYKAGEQQRVIKFTI